MECSEFEENKKRPFYIFFIIYNMLIVSLDVSIQECQWQLLSVHLWAFCNPPIAHDKKWCMMCER